MANIQPPFEIFSFFRIEFAAPQNGQIGVGPMGATGAGGSSRSNA